MNDHDTWNALQALNAWFADHPDCREPAEGVRALGLPDATGVPADRRAWTSTHRRMAAEAGAMLDYAGYAMRKAARTASEAT
jgi:hypothetical protein